MITAELLLNLLLEKFENSKAFSGEQKRKLNIRLKLASDPVFASHKNGSEELDIAIGRLRECGVCEIAMDQDYLDYIELKLDSASIEKAYKFAKRNNPKEVALQYASFFEGLISSSQTINAFSADCLSILSRNKPAEIQRTYGSIEDIKKIVLCIETMEGLDNDIAERIFSVNVLGDSKAFEAYKNRIAKILRLYSDVPFEEDEDPIAALGVIQNRTYAFVKGEATIKIENQVIDLSAFGNELALSDSMIRHMEILSVSAESLFTVENLTSFNEFSAQKVIVVYLGGFHNSVRRNLIKKITDYKPGISAFHYGDIDAGGFYILNHLREKTGVYFEPYRMGVEELRRYSNKTKKLTASDRKRLEKMAIDIRFNEFLEVIKYMLDYGVKLEQEAELDI